MSTAQDRTGRVARFKKSLDHRIHADDRDKNGPSPDRASVLQGEIGEILSDFPPSSELRIRLHNRLQRCVVTVKSSDVDISVAEFGKWRVDYALRHLQDIKELGRAAPGQVTGLAKHIAALLQGVAANHSKLRDIEGLKRYIWDATARDRTATTLVKNIKTASPELARLLETPDFDIHDILREAPKIADKGGVISTHDTCGIYLIAYLEFKAESAYSGVHIYVGQSIHCIARLREHRSGAVAAKGPGYNTPHYKCHREATKWLAVQLCIQDPAEGGNEKAANALRDIYENVMFLLLRSYAEKILKPDTAKIQKQAQAGGLSQALLRSHGHVEVGTLLDRIAEESFAATGYADPFSPERKKSFGVAGGCNVSSPIGSETRQMHDKIVWSMTYLPQQAMRVFRRPGQFVAKNHERESVMVANMKYYDAEGGHHTFDIHVPITPGSPSPGDEVSMAWEVMDKGRIHDAPYFALPDVGCWTNWTDVLRLGLKIIFKPQNSTKYYVKWIQDTHGSNYGFTNHQVPGSNWRYAVGAGILAYLLRSEWPKVQRFVYRFGVAHVIEVVADPFMQQATCNPVVGPIEVLSGPDYKLDFATWQLNRLRATDSAGVELPDRLTNVDGPWQSFDHSWIDAYRKARATAGQSGKFADVDGKKVVNVAVGVKRRQSDSFSTSFLRLAGGCERMKDSNGQDMNWCKPCFGRGIPCSWTRADHLGGEGWNDAVPGKESKDIAWVKYRGPFFEKLMKALFRRPINPERLKTYEVPNPGYALVSNEQEDTDDVHVYAKGDDMVEERL
ncbi:hypothetical protein LTR53_002611 [Teratosphaeriaceae sp. CCFEE 6253]|nr:hypothetical protein LTR53_002611 [Teratosphaeriaceae sp. CCFEE 6253]